MKHISELIEVNLNKLLNSMLAIAMVAMMLAPVTAMAANEYTIVIRNSVSGKDYSVYKIFDAAYSSDSIVVYTIDESSAWYGVISGNSSLFTLVQKDSSSIYYVYTADDKDEDDVTEYLSALEIGTDVTADPVATMTGTGGSLTIDVGSSGYFYVSSEVGSIVTLTSVKTSSTVFEKNAVPGVVESESADDGDEEPAGSSTENKGITPSVASASVGEDATYTSTLSVPLYNGINLVKSYTVTMELSDGLTLDTSSVQATLKAGDSSEEMPEKFIDATGSGFVIEYDAYNNDDLTIYESYSDVSLELEYTATLNVNVEYTNTSKISVSWEEYTTNYDGTFDSGSVNTKEGASGTSVVYAYGFKLTCATDEEGSNPLTGAKFKLYTAETDGDEIGFAYNDTTYTYIAVSSEEDCDTLTYVTEIEAGSNVQVFGLEAGTYWIEQTLASDGYNPIDKRESVELSAEVETEDGYVAQPVVVNKAGSLLPTTGAAGTFAMYAVGACLVGSAANRAYRRHGAHSA